MKKNLFVASLSLLFIAFTFSCKKETTGTVNVTLNISDSLYAKILSQPAEVSIGVSGSAVQIQHVTGNHKTVSFTVNPGHYGVSAAFQTWNQFGSSVTQEQTKYGDISAGDNADVSLDF